MTDDEPTIFDVARETIRNNRAISSYRAKRMAEFILEHEPLPEIVEANPFLEPDPVSYEDETPDHLDDDERFDTSDEGSE